MRYLEYLISAVNELTYIEGGSFIMNSIEYVLKGSQKESNIKNITKKKGNRYNINHKKYVYHNSREKQLENLNIYGEYYYYLLKCIGICKIATSELNKVKKSCINKNITMYKERNLIENRLIDKKGCCGNEYIKVVDNYLKSFLKNKEYIMKERLFNIHVINLLFIYENLEEIYLNDIYLISLWKIARECSDLAKQARDDKYKRMMYYQIKSFILINYFSNNIVRIDSDKKNNLCVLYKPKISILKKDKLLKTTGCLHAPLGELNISELKILYDMCVDNNGMFTNMVQTDGERKVSIECFNNYFRKRGIKTREIYG